MIDICLYSHDLRIVAVIASGSHFVPMQLHNVSEAEQFAMTIGRVVTARVPKRMMFGIGIVPNTCTDLPLYAEVYAVA